MVSAWPFKLYEKLCTDADAYGRRREREKGESMLFKKLWCGFGEEELGLGLFFSSLEGEKVGLALDPALEKLLIWWFRMERSRRHGNVGV